jgi:hypothetical protein
LRHALPDQLGNADVAVMPIETTNGSATRHWRGYMRFSRIAAFLLAVGMAISGASFAQTGHPAKGGWVGYWGPNDKDRRRVVLEMDWQDNKVVGVINPGPKAVKVRNATIDYDTWTLVLEAELPDASGKPVRWVATGKLENLGSWTNRRYSGTYQHGADSGKFLLTLH